MEQDVDLSRMDNGSNGITQYHKDLDFGVFQALWVAISGRGSPSSTGRSIWRSVSQVHLFISVFPVFLLSLPLCLSCIPFAFVFVSPIYIFFPCLCVSHVFLLPLSLSVSTMCNACVCLCPSWCLCFCKSVSLAFFVFVFSWWPDLLFYCCCVCFSLPANYNLWQGWTWTMVWGTAIMRMEWTLKRPAFANPAPFLRCQSYLQPLKSN